MVDGTLFYASTYAMVIGLLCCTACLQLLHLAYQLERSPPQFIIDTWDERTIVTAHFQDTNVLWFRIIAAIYGVMSTLAICSMYLLPDTATPKNSCYISIWLLIHAAIDILCVIVIMLCLVHEFDMPWRVVPVPFLAVAVLAWIIVDQYYNSIIKPLDA